MRSGTEKSGGVVRSLLPVRCIAAAKAFEAKFPVRQRDVDMLNAGLRDGTAETARLMGIPVVMANKVWRLVTEVPAGFPAQDIEFPGFSAIADSDGRLLAQLGTGQGGVVVRMITLDPALKRKTRVPPLHGRWNAAMPWWAFAWTITQRMGERSSRTRPIGHGRNSPRRTCAGDGRVARPFGFAHTDQSMRLSRIRLFPKVSLNAQAQASQEMSVRTSTAPESRHTLRAR